MNKKTMADVRALNASAGDKFFTRNNMRFAKSRIESSLLKGKYFITSEQSPHNPRRYTVRMIDWQTGSIKTIGGSMCDYRTKSDARIAINIAAGKEADNEI